MQPPLTAVHWPCKVLDPGSRTAACLLSVGSAFLLRLLPFLGPTCIHLPALPPTCLLGYFLFLCGGSCALLLIFSPPHFSTRCPCEGSRCTLGLPWHSSVMPQFGHLPNCLYFPLDYKLIRKMQVLSSYTWDRSNIHIACICSLNAHRARTKINL